MTGMTSREFDRRYRDNPDPWGYRTSPYERAKYAATLDACGPGPFVSALELGGSIGVFSALLAPRCRSLTTIDYSATAVSAAEAELARYPHARAILGRIPDDLPAATFDLIVASEVLYYLDDEAFIATLAAIEQRLARPGRLVCVHWQSPGPERPLSAEHVHTVIRRQPWLHPISSESSAEYLLDSLEAT